jgi:hypothetical protein
MNRNEMRSCLNLAIRILVASVIVFAVSGQVIAQTGLNVTQVILSEGDNYLNGVDQHSYYCGIDVMGTGITSVQVNNQDGVHSWALASDGGEFDAGNYFADSYSTLAAMRVVFPAGNYTFNVNNGAMQFTLNMSGVFPTTVASGLAPANGATGVSLTPTLSWSAVPNSAGVGLHTSLRLSSGHGGPLAENIYPFPTTATSWIPSVGMNPNTGYQWEVDVAAGAIYNETFGNDSFAAYSVSTNDNDVNFTTKVCIPGDINGDGLVDVADYNIWAANVGKTGASWSQGDMNGDGLVDVADYNIWAANVGKTAGTPEPITLSLLAVGGLAIMRRRK